MHKMSGLTNISYGPLHTTVTFHNCNNVFNSFTYEQHIIAFLVKKYCIRSCWLDFVFDLLDIHQWIPTLNFRITINRHSYSVAVVIFGKSKQARPYFWCNIHCKMYSKIHIVIIEIKEKRLFRWNNARSGLCGIIHTEINQFIHKAMKNWQVTQVNSWPNQQRLIHQEGAFFRNKNCILSQIFMSL